MVDTKPLKKVSDRAEKFKKFFNTSVPACETLALNGDITPADILTKVEKVV